MARMTEARAAYVVTMPTRAELKALPPILRNAVAGALIVDRNQRGPLRGLGRTARNRRLTMVAGSMAQTTGTAYCVVRYVVDVLWPVVHEC